MNTNQQTASKEVTILKEKINLKKMDRTVYVNETEAVIRSMKDEKNALVVGNVCLRHMTNKQLRMPIELNARVFADHPPRERLCMQKTRLQESIGINDSKLFKLGKRLLKQDYLEKQREANLAKRNWELEQAKRDAQHNKNDYDDRCEKFLHKQVVVEDSRNRELSAKLTYQRFQKVLDELNKDLLSYPVRIKNKQKLITEKRMEVQDFTGLRDRAKRYLSVEEQALKPVNDELESVTRHFDQLIVTTRNEIDDRRKDGALAKFLAEREANSLSFSETANMMDIQYKKRNKDISAYDVIMNLLDATMVSDIDNVIDCFLDQTEVTDLLLAEKKLHQEKNYLLKAQLESLRVNNEFLKYDSNKSTRVRRMFQTVVEEEKSHARDIDQMDTILKKEDNLMAALQLSLGSLSEKLRPIKLEDAAMNETTGEINHDINVIISKMKRMMSVIKNNTVPVGPVRTNLLNLYKEARVPADSIRVDMTRSGISPSMTSFENFEADSPGLVTREMLKARAAESSAKDNKKKQGDKGKRDRKRH